MILRARAINIRATNNNINNNNKDKYYTIVFQYTKTMIVLGPE